MIELNADNVLAAIERAVNARGADYVYSAEFGTKCLYVVGGRPACLVGEVLHTDFGIPFEQLARFEDADSLLLELYDEGLVRYSDTAHEMLQQAQAAQDAGRPWGEALAVAQQVAMEATEEVR